MIKSFSEFINESNKVIVKSEKSKNGLKVEVYYLKSEPDIKYVTLDDVTKFMNSNDSKIENSFKKYMNY